jgi:hypothetical protein
VAVLTGFVCLPYTVTWRAPANIILGLELPGRFFLQPVQGPRIACRVQDKVKTGIPFTECANPVESRSSRPNNSAYTSTID